MARITRLVGTVLILIGVLAYGLTAAASPTALLPAALGVIVLALGLLARREPLRRHAIHAALAVALLGFLSTFFMQAVQLPALVTGGAVERPGAVIAGTMTALVCAVYVVLGVRSFAAARRARSAA